MKISKVDHMKSGISQEPVDKSGMLYRQSETKLTGKALEEHIAKLNTKAKGLYKALIMPKDDRLALFMNGIVSRMKQGDSCDQVVRYIKLFSEAGTPIDEIEIRRTVDRFLRGSLRRYVRGEQKYLPDIIYDVLCEKFGNKENREGVSEKDLEILVKALFEDYFKEEQMKKIATSLEKQTTPVRIEDVDGKKRIILSSAHNPKKEYIFSFIKEYAGKTREEQQQMLRRMRVLILLYFYGSKKITKEYQEEVTAWNFGTIVQDKEVLFAEEAFMLLQDREYEKQQLQECKGIKNKDERKAKEGEHLAKLRRISDKIKDDIRSQCVLHYQEACASAEKTEQPWIRYVSDQAMHILIEKKNISPDKLSVAYLSKEVWKIWLSFVAKKYIDMGKGVYHFTMSKANAAGKEKHVELGVVDPEYADGISSFDYERIKAEDDLHRSMSAYVLFAANNFSRSVYDDTQREKKEDILNVGLNSLTLYDQAKENILRYFGGASNWEDSVLEIVDTEELVECVKKYMKIARNENFHFAGSAGEEEAKDEVLEIILEKEIADVGKYYRKTYYANNVTMFYPGDDIRNLMDHLYQQEKNYLVQIPSFNKVISKTYLPNIIFRFLKGKNRTRISEPGTMLKFQGAFYYVLKEIYYHNFLQEADLKTLFCEGLKKAKDGQKQDKPYEHFMKRFKQLESMELNFGEICQQIMTDYEQQNGQNKKKASAIYTGEGKKPREIKDNSQKYKHYRTLLYIGLREAFMDYLMDERNRELFGFLREPQVREQKEEKKFIDGWELKLFSDRKELAMSNSVAAAWYITAHFINQKQLNHLIGDIKNYIQFIQDIDRRAKNTGNRVSKKTQSRVDKYYAVLRMLEFTKYFCAQTTNCMEDYYPDEKAFAEHIGKYVQYRSGKKEIQPKYELQAFCDKKIKVGNNKIPLGIYYDGMNPIMNRNLTLASMYGNEKVLSAAMEPVKESDIQHYYKLKDEMKDILKNAAVCDTEEKQKKLREFQNLKNRIELVDVLALSELLNDLYGQLLGWAYIRERDMMYLQLGIYYVKLYYTDTEEADSFLRKLEINEECRIDDGAVLYQIAAMYSFSLPLYTRKENTNQVADEVNKESSLGVKFREFEGKYCRDNGSIIENGLCLFENINDHKRMSDFRNDIAHFRYYAKQKESILDMYSTVYDSFFLYDTKMKKSVSYMLTNILLSYFVNATLSFSLKGQAEYEKGGMKYTRTATCISIKDVHSDYFTYKLRSIIKGNNGGEMVDSKQCTMASVAARSPVFIKEVRKMLEYKAFKK